MELTKIPYKAIVPYVDNPRLNDQTIEMLKNSILEFGYLQPITIDSNFIIVTGHTRHKAIGELIEEGHKEFETIECYILDELEQEKVEEFRIADNAIFDLSEWDSEKLAVEIKSLDSLLAEFRTDILDKLKDIGGFSVEDVTDEDIEKKEKELDNKFTKNTEARDKDTIMYKCPCCGEEFGMRSKDLKGFE